MHSNGKFALSLRGIEAQTDNLPLTCFGRLKRLIVLRRIVALKQNISGSTGVGEISKKFKELQ